jgi:hypothetical protein
MFSGLLRSEYGSSNFSPDTSLTWWLWRRGGPARIVGGSVGRRHLARTVAGPRTEQARPKIAVRGVRTRARSS